MTAPTESRVLDTTVRMLEKHPLCDRCLGRQFAWLSTNTSNADRGRSLKLILSMNADDELKSGEESGKETISLLAGKGMFAPAQTIAQKNSIEFNHENQCHLCSVEGQSIFDRMESIAKRAMDQTKDIEFDTFLVGTISVPVLDEKQDELRAEHSLLHAEALKSDFSRELGKHIHALIGKEVNFDKPHLVFLYDIVSDIIQLQINPIFIYGRYRKLKRGIPQSRWDCNECRGKGCDDCGGTGRRYPDSISEYVGVVAQRLTEGTRFKFHAAGREDVDVLMLGDGRPFVVEISEPKIRNPDLKSLMKMINKEAKKRIQVQELQMTNRERSQKLKEDASTNIKEYAAIIETSEVVDEIDLQRAEREFSGTQIEQRTPVRVSHRRSDLVREKMIHEIRFKKKSTKMIEAFFKVQGGTYVKELISGDTGRTDPSVAGVLGTDCFCKELNVTAIYGDGS
ncbi:MAG: tRNA pseudouridine(54/55) synthase Pus10 [Candidatus Thorarchaeota archaeon]|jgi:tRNA pseudouridine synthase 10